MPTSKTNGKINGLSRRDFLKISGAAGAGLWLPTLAALPVRASSPQAQGTPVSGGILIEGRTYEPLDLNPATTLNTEAGQIIMARLYEPLVAPGPTLEPIPQLATSWEMTDDSTWVFKIRQGVKFHSGADLTVEDVKATYDHIMNPETGHPAARFLGEVDSVEIVDDETIQFNMNALNGVFPNQQHWCYIQSQSSLEQGAEFLQSNVDGTGPFMLSSWQPDIEMQLVRFEDYWDEGKPYLDGITMKVFPEEASAIAALRAGEIDFITLEDPNNYALLENDPNLSLVTVSANGGNFWCFNGDREPMNDVKVRQAISAAINREEVVQLVGAGLGVPSGVITPAFADLSVPPEEIPYYQYDPELARQLLSESSVPDGFTMDCVYIDTLPIMRNGAQLFAQYMEAIGITVELRAMETNVWVDAVTNTGDFYFTTNLDIGGPTPEAILTSLACGSALADFYGPCSEEIDALVLQAAGTTDADERRALWREIQIKVGEQQPNAVWIYARTHVVATQPWVQGFVAYPDKAHRQLGEVWLQDKPGA